MIDRLTTPEVYPGQRRERIAAGVALLSLDQVAPVYGCIGFRVADRDRFQRILRQAVENNRRTFARHPESVPDLLEQVRSAFSQAGQANEAEIVREWLAATYVNGPDDYRAYSTLNNVLLHTRREPKLLDELGVPVEARPALIRAMSVRDAYACLTARYEDVAGAELSEWDASVYARMRFYDEFRDPFVFLSNTCEWIDFVPTVRLLVDLFGQGGENAFMERVRSAALRLKVFSDTLSLTPPSILAPAHA